MEDERPSVLEVPVGTGRETKGATPLERVAASEEQRKAEWENRKAQARDNADPRESARAFLSQFGARAEAIKGALEGLRTNACPDKESLRKMLEQQLADAAELQKAVAESSYFLSAYDVQQCGVAIQGLRRKIEDAQRHLLPRPKFSFSKRSRQTKEHAVAVESQSTAKKHVDNKAKQDDGNCVVTLCGKGLEGLRGQEVHVSGEELGTSDYALVNLEGCTVVLLGTLSALHVRNVKKCKILVAAVTGATLLEDLDSCHFYLASSQVRIHCTRDTSFYLRVRSNPIIEHSSTVGVGPLPSMQVPGWDDWLEAAQLSDENDLWCKVNDFGWLRESQSPNWYVIPDDQRQSAPVASS